jgi:hypothetical protein
MSDGAGDDVGSGSKVSLVCLLDERGMVVAAQVERCLVSGKKKARLYPRFGKNDIYCSIDQYPVLKLRQHVEP